MTQPQRASRRPPGPDQAVSLGIDAETLSSLTAMQREYGNLVSMVRPNGRLAYFINDPDEVRRVLVRRHGRYRKGPGFERVKMLLGNGLIVSDGDVWRRSRTMIQPAFSRQNVHELLRVMVACTDRRAVRWAEIAAAGETLNITAETCDFALELILVSIFGDDYERHIVTDGENPFAFLSRDSARDLGVVMKVRHLRELLMRIISGRRAGEGSRHFDFLSMYLAATDKSGQPFSDAELLDELMTLIVAGFETSANTLNWVWYLVAGHPAVEARLIEEAERILPNVSALDADALAAMVYTQQVLEETLRLYPPVWLFTRRAHDADELEHYDVPPGTDIYLSPYILHRTAEFWPDPDRFDPDTAEFWPDPDRFDPDRFELGDRPKKEHPFFPFSLGPRRCLGEYFSFLEMKVHLGFLLPRFRMHRVDDRDPGLELGINLRSAEDITMRPEERRSTAPGTT